MPGAIPEWKVSLGWISPGKEGQGDSRRPSFCAWEAEAGGSLLV